MASPTPYPSSHSYPGKRSYVRVHNVSRALTSQGTGTDPYVQMMASLQDKTID